MLLMPSFTKTAPLHYITFRYIIGPLNIQTDWQIHAAHQQGSEEGNAARNGRISLSVLNNDNVLVAGYTVCYEGCVSAYYYYWRSLQFLSWSRSSQQFLEFVCSLPCTQQSTINPVAKSITPVHILLLCLYKVHFNIVISSTCKFSLLFFCLDFPTQTLYPFLIFSLCVTRPTHLSLLHLTNPIISGDD